MNIYYYKFEIELGFLFLVVFFFCFILIVRWFFLKYIYKMEDVAIEIV